MSYFFASACTITVKVSVAEGRGAMQVLKMEESKLQKSPRGYFVGLTTMDYVFYVNSHPQKNSKVKTNHFTRLVGGPAANAAITYSLLGGNATLVTCLGNTAESDVIKETLQKFGVTVFNCTEDDVMPAVAAIAVDRNGDRQIFSGQNQYKAINAPALEEPAFCLFDLNQQELSLAVLRNCDCEIVVDAGSWKGETLAFLKKASVVISSEEFRDPAGRDIFSINECRNAKKAMTRGEKPVLLTDGEIPVASVTCVDSLAAGDIFHGAFCFAYYHKQFDFKAALTFASTIATESVKYEGPWEWAKQV